MELKKYKVKFRGQEIEIEQLSNGKFKKPSFVKNLQNGYAGYQPKPSLEVILCVQKPIEEKSFVDQALKNGKGVTWLDSCRIPFQNEDEIPKPRTSRITDIRGNSYGKDSQSKKFLELDEPIYANPKGRFPANLLVSDDSLNDGKITKSHVNSFEDKRQGNGIFAGGLHKNNNSYNDSGSHSRYFDLDSWSNAQFIITPKASPSERQGSTHPTMKPIRLMSFLITMGSRPNDIILDPFCGSGTTGIAALQLGRKFIGIEKELEYVEIANKRLEPYLMEKKITDF